MSLKAKNIIKLKLAMELPKLTLLNHLANWPLNFIH